jgi:hypothetical protein
MTAEIFPEPASSLAAPTSTSLPRLEHMAAWMLRGPLAAILFGVCLIFLVTWVPHYLTWPLFLDDDEFATAAYGWDTGRLPYRDIKCFNFPGQIYLFWVMGKLFGWGKMASYYALDAAFVVSVGLAMVVWSNRKFHRFLPGLAGYITFLSYYLNLNFCHTAQRDWHAAFFAVLGALAVETWPGRAGRLASALAAAAALTFRPQTVLLWPAMVLAIDESARGPGESWWKTIWAALEWGLATLVFVAAAFFPLLQAGLLADFLHGIRVVAYGSQYNSVTPWSFSGEMVKQIAVLRYPAVMISVLILAGPASRRTVLTWTAAMFGTFFYKPISPHLLEYLDHPLALVWSVNVALLVQLVMESQLLESRIKLLLIALILGLGVSGKPQFCNPAKSWQALALLRRGEEPQQRPTGYLPYSWNSKLYPWDDYRNLLDYVRTRTAPDTLVANALVGIPAITGPVARFTAFPTAHLAFPEIAPELEVHYIIALEKPANLIVIWAPSEREFTNQFNFRMDRLAEVIERLYEPEARFGAIEVWKRKAIGPSGG